MDMETNASSSNNGNDAINKSILQAPKGEADEMPIAMDTLEQPPPSTAADIASPVIVSSSAKTLKRCLSSPIIRTGLQGKPTPMTTRAAAAAAAAAKEHHQQTPKKQTKAGMPSSSQQDNLNVTPTGSPAIDCFGKNIHIRSQPNSREVSPAPMFGLFTPRTRRYSASYSPLTTAPSANGAPLYLTPRVSQLRQEECADLNSREVNHEREVHREIQFSQSCEDLTIVAENWSCKSDEFSNPLQVNLPTGSTSCSSPSPTSNRTGMRVPSYSPSPTRRTFATRRSMSPILRPSQLGPVKRKFELEENAANGLNNWSVYSPPLKKVFVDSRASSPVCQSPSSVCPSPDSGTYDGRITPKLLISKLCTTNTNNNSNGSGNNHSSSSGCPSPISASPSGSCPAGGLPALDAISSISGISCTSSASSSSGEPMCSQSLDEGISIPEAEGNSGRSRTSSILSTASSSGVGLGPQVLVNDLADDATLMDDAKSETSSIGGCSTISIESSSCDSGAKAAATFLNRLVVDDGAPKSFYINKQGLCGAKKFIVNHENLDSSAKTKGKQTNTTRINTQQQKL